MCYFKEKYDLFPGGKGCLSAWELVSDYLLFLSRNPSVLLTTDIEASVELKLTTNLSLSCSMSIITWFCSTVWISLFVGAICAVL